VRIGGGARVIDPQFRGWSIQPPDLVSRPPAVPWQAKGEPGNPTRVPWTCQGHL